MVPYGNHAIFNSILLAPNYKLQRSTFNVETALCSSNQKKYFAGPFSFSKNNSITSVLLSLFVTAFVH